MVGYAKYQNQLPQENCPKQEGPFEIIEVLGPLNYHLELPSTWKLHNNFHVTLLMPYMENEVHGPNYLQPPPDIENDEE